MTNKNKDLLHVEELLSLISKKHTLMIVYTLRLKPMGFNEIQETIPVNTSTLSSRLRELTEQDILEMSVCPKDTRQHYYGLTTRGRTLGGVLKLLTRV